jgi:hypothetical protein
MPLHRQSKACAAETAVQEVSTAVSKLHAEVEVRAASTHATWLLWVQWTQIVLAKISGVAAATSCAIF